MRLLAPTGVAGRLRLAFGTPDWGAVGSNGLSLINLIHSNDSQHPGEIRVG
jgi:hypothetical protein